ncbi:MAG: ammonium transporter [Candidatus Eremiobacteraeota bacterium]|nr:ammonium transporter [Candidatus Eremiobacteraeota bacterium]MBV9409576.1 ammonium transporter [Candidatus Eremiobacteraeota bacterium]
MSAGDTAWVLASAALVMLMTPGLGFFYGGLVRRKNVLSTVMHSFFILCLISVQWVLWGYSLAFGPDFKGWGIIGDLSWIGLNGVTLAPDKDYAATIPHQAYMVFQMMFAIITPALISGAFAERKRFKAFVLFSLLWATFVYDPLAHWVWGHGGWLSNLGALDFAGGTVVHISSGVSALVAAWVLGKRITHKPGEEVEPHDIPMVVLGCALLWFGWFGFNAGSALAANGLATSAFVNTNTAAAMAALTWMTISWMHKGVPSVVGATAGAVAGLVAITPAAGYVTPAASILIGLVVSLVCYAAVQLRDRMNVDDALDVWAVHGVGGTVGAICTGLFATTVINSGAANGLFYGNPKQLLIQVIAVGASWVFSGVMTFVILKVVNVFVPLRVSEKEEAMGLDLSQHSEIAYSPS